MLIQPVALPWNMVWFPLKMKPSVVFTVAINQEAVQQQLSNTEANLKIHGIREDRAKIQQL